MWKVAYNVLITVLFPLFTIFALFNRKIRKTYFERLFPDPLEGDLCDTIWVHAASIGEAVIGETLVRYMRDRGLMERFILTTNTYYTKDMLERRFAGLPVHVVSLPFDFIWSVTRFLSSSSPSALILIETELWPNLIWQASKRGIPVIVVNGRISDKTVKNYRRFSFFVRHVLAHIGLVIAQSAGQARRFVSIGMDTKRVSYAGNLKYYRDITTFADNQDKDNVVTFGSIKAKEVDQVLSVIQKLKVNLPAIRCYVVPRELILVSEIEEKAGSLGRVVRYSVSNETEREKADIIVVDTVGQLLDIYRISKVAFVGGSLAPYGGQNLLEPLFFATPVLFGPYVGNFRDVADEIIARGAGFAVASADDLGEKMQALLLDETSRQQMGLKGLEIVKKQNAVIEKTTESIMGEIRRCERGISQS
jgi:3-deoxy-D-manno-octulosonic-acid transferase